jgi:hypothetical protein
MAIWTVSTHYKKSCQEVEHWVRSEGEGKITVTNGFRYGEWTVETSDDNPPEFEFTEVPGGDGRKDSINMLDCEINNIESVELVEMFDGGCWYDIDVTELDEEAQAEIEDFIEENSIYDLEDRDEDSWYNDETEWWIWGPIEIKNEAGETVRIICADENGNVVDFKED